MARIETPESLHETDWEINKPDDTSLQSSGRFQALIKLIKKHNPDKVFDIGCGSGFLCHMIKSWKPETELHGCDISNVALDRAKLAMEKVWMVNLNIEGIPVESDTYDVVICSEVLEHIYDVNHALLEVSRLLKPKGIGLLTVPNLVYWRYRWDILLGHLPISVDDDRHLHQFTQKSFKEKLNKADMTGLSVSGFRKRFPWLADWKPSVFSDTLIFEVIKSDKSY